MEGIVLKSTPFGDTGRIITIYTQDSGVVSAILRRIGQKNLTLQNATSVLSLSEFHLVKGKGDLYRFQDASLIDNFLELRNHFDKLTAAGNILKCIQKTQIPENPSPALYLLLKTYLYNMKTSENPENLYLSFQLKLLQYEGVFSPQREHSPVFFTQEEWELVKNLSFAKSFTNLSVLKTPKNFNKKLSGFFSLSFH